MTIPSKENTSKEEKKASKVERLEARITREQKELLQTAADLEGRTLTDFVLSSAQEKALRTIEEYNIIKLSGEESVAFVESLLNPPEPSPRMLAAAQEYKRSMGLE
ncbi:MAG: DUF1778 domain-containing protein [Pyrinomonadaceae bacterium]